MKLSKLLNIDKTKGQQVLGMYVADEAATPRRSPLHALHERLGARFIVFGDALWVDWYDDNLQNEYLQLNTGVAVCDISQVTMLSVKGPEVFETVTSCFTRPPTARHEPGRMLYGGFVRNGKLVDDGMIFIVSDQELLITVNISFDDFRGLFSEATDSCLHFTDLTDSYVKLQLQGPGADKVLHGKFSTEPVPFFHFRNLGEAIIANCGFTLPGGYEIYLPLDAGMVFWEELIAAGVTPYGISVMEISRVEAMKICNGQEFGAEIFSPSEVGLMPIESQQQENLRVRLAYFLSDPMQPDPEVLPEIGNILRNDTGKAYGIITSFVFSPLYGRYVGFCHLSAPVSDYTSLVCNGLYLTLLNLEEARKFLHNDRKRH